MGGEAHSAGGLGLGTAAAAKSVADDRVTEEGTCGSACTESVFSSFSLTGGSSTLVPVEESQYKLDSTVYFSFSHVTVRV